MQLMIEDKFSQKEIKLIKTFKKKYNILISYEGNKSFQQLDISSKIPKSELHNLIYTHADLCIK